MVWFGFLSEELGQDALGQIAHLVVWSSYPAVSTERCWAHLTAAPEKLARYCSQAAAA